MQFPVFAPTNRTSQPQDILVRGIILAAIACLLLAAGGVIAPRYSASASELQTPASGGATLQPFVYAAASSNYSYDIMLSGGVSKDRRVARIKVDSVFFGTLSARLSVDNSFTAFRVSGDRRGGSSLYSVDVRTGKYVAIDAAKTASESIGAYAWSPAGNTLAYVRADSAPDPPAVDDSYGTVYIFSVGFKSMPLASSNGSDRLLGFSGDGLGVYAARKDGAYEHLVYLPLSGGQAHMILRSQPALQFSGCAVLSQPGISSRVACIAEGNFAQIYPSQPVAPVSKPTGEPPIVQPTPAPQSRVLTSGKLSRPNGLGIAIANADGSSPILLRRDAEAFPFLAWKPDGSGLIMGGTRSGAAWAVDMSGNRQALGTSLLKMDALTWADDNSMVLLSDAPSTHLVSVRLDTGKVAATKYVGVAASPGPAAVKLPVPYIHQVKDTAENGNGNWACGPTSVAMALAYFRRIDPWTMQEANNLVAAPNATAVAPAPQGTPKPVTGADYAPYITNKYTAYGHTYNLVARDPSGNMLAGLYGTIAPSGLASWQQMEAVLTWHNLSSQWISDSWDGIVAALKRGHPVLLGNQLTSEGHIILVIGYTADGNLVVHDPYGNRFGPGYGANDGNGVVYPWKLVTPRRALEIIGTVPPNTPTPTRTAVPTKTPTLTATPTAQPSPTP